MNRVTYKIVEHDGAGLIPSTGYFRNRLLTTPGALAAARRAANEQRVPGRTEAIEYETPMQSGTPRPPPAMTGRANVAGQRVIIPRP